MWVRGDEGGELSKEREEADEWFNSPPPVLITCMTPPQRVATRASRSITHSRIREFQCTTSLDIVWMRKDNILWPFFARLCFWWLIPSAPPSVNGTYSKAFSGDHLPVSALLSHLENYLDRLSSSIVSVSRRLTVYRNLTNHSSPRSTKCQRF